MNYLLLNLFLALSWMLINGNYSSSSFLMGFVVGFVVLGLCLGRNTNYFRRCRAVLKLVLYFSYQMLVSVVRVVWDVITPTHLSEPDIVLVPLDAHTDIEVTLLANMVSLTPGTLSLDVTPDKKHLIVHAMFAPRHDEVIDDIKNGLEKQILEVTRG